MLFKKAIVSNRSSGVCVVGTHSNVHNGDMSATRDGAFLLSALIRIHLSGLLPFSYDVMSYEVDSTWTHPSIHWLLIYTPAVFLPEKQRGRTI